MFATIINSNKIDINIDNMNGTKKVCLHEVFYTVSWKNVSTQLENNTLQLGDKTIQIEDGYYDFCSLKDVLAKHGINGELNQSNLRVTLTWNIDLGRLNIPDGLEMMLGLHSNPTLTEEKQKYILKGTHPMKLAVHEQMYIEMEELNNSYNTSNNMSSHILRLLPRSRGAYCEQEWVEFKQLQYKKLSHNRFTSLSAKLVNQDRKTVECSNLIITLEII